MSRYVHSEWQVRTGVRVDDLSLEDVRDELCRMIELVEDISEKYCEIEELVKRAGF